MKTFQSASVLWIPIAFFFAGISALLILSGIDKIGLEAISAIGDILVGAAAICGTFVAWSGLKTWRRERDADLAKQMAASLYRLKRNLHWIRAPFKIPLDKEFLEDFQDQKYPAWLLKHRRWQRGRSDFEQLESLIAEAELRWIGDFEKLLDPIRAVDDRLFRLILSARVLEERAVGPTEEKLAQWEKLQEVKGQLDDTFNADDPLRKDIDKSFEAFNAFLRTKM